MLSFAVVIANVSYAIAPCVVVAKCGGLNGKYKYVDEVHDAPTNTHKLTCQDPGTDVCVWTTPPPELIGTSYEAIDDLVSGNINNDMLEGSEAIGNGVVTWTASSSNCYSYTFR